MYFIRNRPGNAQVPSTQTASIPTEVAGGEPTYPEVARISLDDAKKAFDDNSAVFVDVRSATSFAESHIPGAVNIPLSDINTRSGELDPNEWIITYCT
jgi:3-mercaptopyruvate sulfurtransferase SseA